MTLFTTLLVLIAERLFKLGEHWQLDHRLEVVFRRIKHFSLPGTLLMTLVAVAVVYIIQRLLQGQLFNIPLLVFWILLGLLCIGAGKVRLHEVHRDPGYGRSRRHGLHARLRHLRDRPHDPARGPARRLRLPHGRLRSRADPGHDLPSRRSSRRLRLLDVPRDRAHHEPRQATRGLCSCHDACR